MIDIDMLYTCNAVNEKMLRQLDNLSVVEWSTLL